MNIQQIYASAPERVRSAPQEKRIVSIYAGITVGVALLVTAVNYVLGLQIDQMGGLSNMGLRSILTTVQSILPMVQSVALMVLELGYISAMLRISRANVKSVDDSQIIIDISLAGTLLK